eukprot:NODE_3759_length_922_cov_12.156930_g3457_i0.p1 GENE.NODE_3759_length_922_cov_12.156930_g3457_i0~~NODE_3759_length_922_cov_12.156930_g3457_i0.p1  ORF type:complete len:257 (+),score=50.85 NODE_3759_length_922_cov_12.156930_g3457_i0:117-887(+)
MTVERSPTALEQPEEECKGSEKLLNDRRMSEGLLSEPSQLSDAPDETSTEDAEETEEDAAPVSPPIMAPQMVQDQVAVYHMVNAMGRTFEIVREGSDTPLIKGQGKLLPYGYNIKFFSPDGELLGRLKSHIKMQDHYTFCSPEKVVMATARRRAVQAHTSIRVFSGEAIDGPQICKLRSEKVVGGDALVMTPSGMLLGTINRDIKKGVIMRQHYTLVVSAHVDPLFMIMLMTMYNCVGNERSKILFGGFAAFAVLA